MKKIIKILICLVLATVICMPFTAIMAAPPTYNVPKAATLPALDSVINDDEWADALVIEMAAGDDSLFVAAGELDMFGGATFRFMWADEGIYFAVTSTGNGEPGAVPETGSGSYNAGNGVQFNIYPNRDISGATVEEMFFFSYHPNTSGGVAQVGEHFIYGTGGEGADVPDAEIAVVMNGNDYTMEGLIPASSLLKSNTPIRVVSGASIFWNNVIMLHDGITQGLIIDNEWFDGALAGEYILTDTLAGINPQAEVEAVEEPEAPPAAAEVSEVSDAEPPVSVAAPPTGDISVILIFTALITAALFFILKLKIKKLC
jgi:hypothetical protein